MGGGGGVQSYPLLLARDTEHAAGGLLTAHSWQQLAYKRGGGGGSLCQILGWLYVLILRITGLNIEADLCKVSLS